MAELEEIKKSLEEKRKTVPEGEPSKEMEMLASIIESDKTKEEKISEIEYLLLVMKTMIDDYLNEAKEYREKNKKVLQEKRRLYRELNKAKKSSQEEIQECIQACSTLFKQQEIRIKEVANEMNRLRKEIQKCHAALAEIKDLKAVKPLKTTTSERRKVKKVNYYYKIMEELLVDDRNYFMIKALIEINPNFRNARSEDRGEHILCKIIDCLIRDLKLEIANVKKEVLHVDYYLALYRLFLKSPLNLHYGETRFIKEKHEYIINLLEQDGKTFEIPEVKKKEELLAETDLNELMKLELIKGNRVNLATDFLKNVEANIQNYMDTYPESMEMQMLSDLNLHSYDVQNSFYIQPTLALEGVKYALNIHYDEDYCLYLRIHLIDTSFITKDSYWYKEMEREIQKKDKRVKKLLSFKEGRKYPAFTIQFKINSNGEVAEPHFYKSSIQIDRVVRNREFLTYREDDALKPLVGALRQVANDYTEEIEFMSIPTIEAFLDFLLNMEFDRIFEKGCLPSLQYVDAKLTDEDIVDIHGNICYYLGKIPKIEAYQVWEILHEVKKSYFFTVISLEDSEMELDTKTFIGYTHFMLLKLYVEKRLIENKRVEYLEKLEEIKSTLNQENTFVGEEKQKQLMKAKEKKEKESQK